MKLGVRMPSPKRSIKAATTGRVVRAAKRTTNPLYGQSGIGFVKDPKRAAYNKVYHSATVGAKDLLSTKGSSGNPQQIDGVDQSNDIKMPLKVQAAPTVMAIIAALIALLPTLFISILINAYITKNTGLVVPVWIILEVIVGVLVSGWARTQIHKGWTAGDDS